MRVSLRCTVDAKTFIYASLSFGVGFATSNFSKPSGFPYYLQITAFIFSQH